MTELGTITEIDTAAEDASTGNVLPLSHRFEGRFDVDDPADWIAVDLEEGKGYSFTLSISSSFSYGGTLRVRDGAGTVLATADDADNDYVSSDGFSIVAPATGRYFLQAESDESRFRQNVTDYTVTAVPVSEGFGNGGSLDTSISESNFFRRPDKWVRFDYEAGDVVRLIAEPLPDPQACDPSDNDDDWRFDCLGSARPAFRVLDKDGVVTRSKTFEMSHDAGDYPVESTLLSGLETGSYYIAVKQAGAGPIRLSAEDFAPGDGDDMVSGLLPPGDIATGRGNDTVFGGRQADTVFGGAGADSIEGSGGNDVLRGGRDNDKIWGENGRDVLRGQAGNDRMNGGTGDDNLKGGSGNDRMAGGQGRDFLKGGLGRDTGIGDGGNDLINGNAGDDVLTGGDGRDRLRGGGGDDTLEGGAGEDILKGGRGADTFHFTNWTGMDRVLDFSPDEDMLKIAGGLKRGRTDAEIAELARIDGNDVILDLGEGNVIILHGLQTTDGLADVIL